MRFIRVAILIAIESFAAFLVAQDAPPGGTVEGTVTDSVTGAGIGEASVVLAGNKSGRYETKSDAAGHFKITGIAPGSYRPDVKKDGFASPTFDLSSLLSNPGLRIASRSDAVKVELTLTPLKTILGRVLGPDGKPAAGVEVAVSPNIMAEVAVTDEEGRFALHDIRPGSYTLFARPPKSAKHEEANGSKTALVTTYYPSAPDQSFSQKIVLRGAGDFDGSYEIQMQTALVHRVRGMVLDEAGKPSAGAELTLVRIPEDPPAAVGLGTRPGSSLFAIGLRRGPAGVPDATAITESDGRFEFPAVPSGDWRINAVSDSAREARGTAGVRVGRSDVDDLEIHVATPFSLNGTVEWKGDDAGNQRVSNPQLPFAAVTLINPDGNEFVGSGFVEPDGRLLFENILPGRYNAIAKPGLSAQIFLGDYEVTGQTFPVTAGGPPMRVILKTWSGTVRGTVEKGEGATVVLVPQQVDGVAIGQTGVCGPGGSFELSDVSPGDYYIAAFDHLEILAAPSAAMLGLMLARGKSVKIKEHEAADVMLSVIAEPR